jgi:hypothetical protein
MGQTELALLNKHRHDMKTVCLRHKVVIQPGH